MADRLKDKVALVVGAGSIGEGWGNGKAAAVAFAREGAAVLCADVNRAAPEQTDKLQAADYANIADNVSDFLLNGESGLEQFYAIVRKGTAR